MLLFIFYNNFYFYFKVKEQIFQVISRNRIYRGRKHCFNEHQFFFKNFSNYKINKQCRIIKVIRYHMIFVKNFLLWNCVMLLYYCISCYNLSFYTLQWSTEAFLYVSDTKLFYMFPSLQVTSEIYTINNI